LGTPPRRGFYEISIFKLFTSTKNNIHDYI
jgi:hypothetical protein